MFPNLEFFHNEYSRSPGPKSFFETLLSGLKQLKSLYMITNNSHDQKFQPDLVLQSFQEHGKKLEEVFVVLKSFSHKDFPSFAIEKRPGGSLGSRMGNPYIRVN
jgi:hypothetical protein